MFAVSGTRLESAGMNVQTDANLENIELSKIASKQGVALCRRLFFAVGFNRRFKNQEAKPLPLWALAPFLKGQSCCFLKGDKPHRGTGKAGALMIRQLKLTAKESLRHGALPH